MRVAAVLVVWMLLSCACHRRDPVKIFTMHADEGHAVAIWGTSNASRSWVGRLGPNGAVQWSHEFDGEPASNAPDGGMLVAHDALVLRYQKHGVVGVRALAIADGHQRWDRILETTSKEREFNSSFDLGEVDREFVVATRDKLFVLDRGTGEIRSTVSLESGQTIRVTPRHVVIVDENGIVSLAPSTGALSRTASDRSGCFDAEEYIQLIDDTLIARSLDVLERTRTIAALARNDETVSSVVGCGRYRGGRVLQVATLDRRLQQTTRIFVFDGKDTFLRVIDLGSDQRSTSAVAHRHADLTNLNGLLPRFVPYALVPFGGLEPHLVIVDLEAGVIEEQRSFNDLVSVGIFRHGFHWIVVPNGQAPVLEIIDGNTGKTIARKQIQATKLDAVEPTDIAEGQIWLPEPGWSTDGFRLFQYDLHTLETHP